MIDIRGRIYIYNFSIMDIFLLKNQISEHIESYASFTLFSNFLSRDY